LYWSNSSTKLNKRLDFSLFVIIHSKSTRGPRCTFNYDEKVYDLGALSKGKKPEGDPGGKGSPHFPGDEAVMSIYSGPIPHES
jgi:hypothetical protein